MAAPAVRSVGAIASGVGDITPALGAGHTTNDIILIYVESAQTIATPPTGYAHVADSPQDSAGALAAATVLSVLWKRHDGSETDPTITDTGNHTMARIVVVSGCITTGDPWDVTSGSTDSAASTSVSVPGDTTTVADTLCLASAAQNLPDGDTTTEFGAPTNASLTSLTERIDNTTSAGNGGGLWVVSGVKAAAGTVDATTCTSVTDPDRRAYHFVALKPPVSAVDLSGVSTIVVNSTGQARQTHTLDVTSTVVLNSAGEADQIQKLAASSTIVVNSTVEADQAHRLAAASTIVVNSIGEADQAHRLQVASTVVLNSLIQARQIHTLDAVSTVVVNSTSSLTVAAFANLSGNSTIVLNSTGQARQIHTLDGISTVVLNSLAEADQIHRLQSTSTIVVNSLLDLDLIRRLLATSTIVVNSTLDLDLIYRLLSTGTVVVNSAGVLTVTAPAAVVTTRGCVALTETLVGALSTSQTLVGRITGSEILVGASSITEESC